MATRFCDNNKAHTFTKKISTKATCGTTLVNWTEPLIYTFFPRVYLPRIHALNEKFQIKGRHTHTQRRAIIIVENGLPKCPSV